MLLSVESLAVSVTRTRGEADGLRITLRYSYEGKLPPRKKRVAMAKTVLDETLERLEELGSEVNDVGFREDAVKRVRTDQWEV